MTLARIFAFVTLFNLGTQSTGVNIYVASNNNGVITTKLIGSTTNLRLFSGNGIIQACAPNAAISSIDCTPSFNTALIATKDYLETDAQRYCPSSNGTTSYACSLPILPSGGVYAPGMTLNLVPDATCATNCSIQIINIGGAGISIKQQDGTTDPNGLIVKGQMKSIWFDGKVFRII